jgi:tetratricopeptide (TPR) repeat protein
MLAAAVVPAAARSDENPSMSLDQQIAKLIAQLGDKDYLIRQRAQEELAKQGFRAYDAVSAATRHEDLEIAARARYLLGLMRMHWCEPSDPPEVRTQLENYELEDVRGRRQRIQALARLRSGAGVSALCRLVRFEESELLSKYAAIEILDWAPDDRAGQARLAQLFREQLAHSTRPAAKWLLGYEDLSENPAAAEAAWIERVKSEEALAKSFPDQSNTLIIVELLYHLAEIQVKQGRTEQAGATAERALRLNPGNLQVHLLLRLEVAQALQHRGLFKWADQEYAQVVKAPFPELAFIAQVTRSEMWHDQGEDLDASKSLQHAIQLLEQIGPGNFSYLDRTPKELRARMNYFLACHWEQQGDRTKQIKCLEEALESDPAEIDVLIACWHLKDQSPEFLKRIAELIDRAATELRREIGDPPEDASACNQFAWLVGNTKGDFDEALRYSLKSLDLSPNNGAFYDTLAHVHFARTELEQAVKNQARAAELEPHSGLIQRELARFRAELERQRKPAPSTPQSTSSSEVAPPERKVAP